MVPGRGAREWIRLFKSAGIPTAGIKDYRSLKWSKALLNIMGNATSAIINRHPSAIYRYGPTFALELDMFEEALAVAHAAGIKLVDLPGPKIGQLVQAVKWLPRSLVKPALTRLVAGGRGEKMPSFQIDLSSGKGQNEVQYHNTAIAAQGRAVGHPAPINEALGTILLKITTKEVDWQRYNGKPDRLVSDVERYRKQMSEQDV
jgi:2-dehydropantoate 2-reductase